MREHPELVAGDAFDEALLQNVHPPQHVNPEPSGRYNLVVIGAGTAGLVSAAGAAGLGAKVALIERNLMGGDCLNVGCVPSKALLRSAHAIADVRGAARFGVRVPEGPSVDFPAVMERMRQIRQGISANDSVARFRDELGVDVYLGQACFTGPNEVEVAGKKLRFSRAVIATGASPFVPPVPGLADAGYYTNETIFSLTELPRRLLVVGGGPIGCELAQAFRRFGAEVTMVEQGAQFLPREDPDAAAILLEALRRDGIDVRLETRLAEVKTEGDAKVASVSQGDETLPIEVDAILVGAGRAPNVENLGLDTAGVAYDARAGVEVDDYLRTTNKRIFAAGDICMSHKFTHAADFAARAVVQNALFIRSRKLSSLRIPWCTYTDPEIAHVGLSERDAEAQGVALDTYRRELSDVDRALADGEEEGFVKIHTRRGGDEILGATIVARHAGEMISEISVAMAGKLGLGAVANVIHPYPTQAEAIRQTGDAYSRTRLTPTVARLFETILRWRR